MLDRTFIKNSIPFRATLPSRLSALRGLSCQEATIFGVLFTPRRGKATTRGGPNAHLLGEKSAQKAVLKQLREGGKQSRSESFSVLL